MPEWDEAAVRSAAARLRLCLDVRRRRHGAGNRLGAGPGASLEFHDHRAYVPGDDLRHVDANVLARTDQVMLRRFRIEVSPRVEILLDASASLGLPPAKARLAAGVTALFAELAARAGTAPRLHVLTGGQARRLDGGGRESWRGRLRDLAAGGPDSLLAGTPPPLAAGSDRILIGDGLCAEGGAAVVRRLGQGAGRICLVQVLSRTELDPGVQGPVRLDDVEGGSAEHMLDDTARSAYRARLARHQEGWAASLRGRGPGLITCVAEDGLDAALLHLTRAGLVEATAR